MVRRRDTLWHGMDKNERSLMKKIDSWKSKINLETLHRTQLEPIEGDIFVVKPKQKDFYYGRVIQAHVTMHAWDGVLVYIYNATSKSKQTIPEMKKDLLLIPPLILDAGCWGLGLVECIGNRILSKQEILDKHCFWDVVFGRYVDLEGNQLPQKTEPCGVYGLTPPRGLDNEISRALRMPLAPD
jgi:hypothetical protein